MAEKQKKVFNPYALAKTAILFAVAAVAVATALLVTGIKPSVLSIGKCETTLPVQSGDTLSKMLTAQGMSPTEIHQIDKLLRESKIASLRAENDKLIVSRENDSAPVDKILLITGPWKQIEIACDENGQWTARVIEIDRDTRIVYKTGKIGDGDSFYSSGMRAGIPAAILADVYDLLAFEIDFERDVRAGQGFSVIYEENFSGGEMVATGAVTAISFDALRGNVKMYRFKTMEGKIGYYDENGNGAIKSLKRTPINNARVTSSFNLKRKHPVLGFTRAHRGVDFRAGTGTPIPSAGAGRVIERKFGKGYGNYITIRHNSTYSTRYAHMSRFQSGVGVGTNVRQGQIIGYVGSTGISTGPHLHYEILMNGHQVNPMTVKLPAISNLSAADKANFISMRKSLDAAAKLLEKHPNMFVQLM